MKKTSLSVVLVASLVIFAIDNFRPKALEFIRSGILMTISPAIKVATTPIPLINNLSAYFNGIDSLYSENKRLITENDRLQNYKELYIFSHHENEELRNLLEYDKRLEKKFTTARIIGDTGGIYARTLLLNAGEVDGVHDGLGVITNKGLLGRTINSKYNTTRVLLLSDINSEIPVVVEGISEYGVLAGTHNDYPALKFMRSTDNIKVGQKILTSGHAGIFPPGIEIGKIISTAGSIKVKLYANITDSSYVRIVKYRFINKGKKVKR